MPGPMSQFNRLRIVTPRAKPEEGKLVRIPYSDMDRTWSKWGAAQWAGVIPPWWVNDRRLTARASYTVKPMAEAPTLAPLWGRDGTEWKDYLLLLLDADFTCFICPQGHSPQGLCDWAGHLINDKLWFHFTGYAKAPERQLDCKVTWSKEAL